MKTEVLDPDPDAMGFAYGLLLKYLMLEIGQFIGASSRYGNMRISLIHDYCDYDASLLNCFNSMLNDPTFRYANNFSTLVPMRWQDCLLLQPADLVAYENFKEAEGREVDRKRRKTLELLLSLESFGAKAKRINRDNLAEIVKMRGWTKPR